jgi:hypothetical protein
MCLDIWSNSFLVPCSHTPIHLPSIVICRLKTSSLWEEPCFWEKAFHIHLPFLLKMVQQRCYKKLHEHGTTPDSRHARKNASMIRLVIWQQAVDRPEALAHHSSEPWYPPARQVPCAVRIFKVWWADHSNVASRVHYPYLPEGLYITCLYTSMITLD